jgi:hypothetical protein
MYVYTHVYVWLGSQREINIIYCLQTYTHTYTFILVVYHLYLYIHLLGEVEREDQKKRAAGRQLNQEEND